MQHPLFMANMACASTRLSWLHASYCPSITVRTNLQKGVVHPQYTDHSPFYALAAQAAPTTRWECDIAREAKNAKV